MRIFYRVFVLLAVGSNLVFSTSGASLPPDVVINEIHYNPDVKTEPAEFIELYNHGTNTVDLSGWSFSAGITYTFPPGTSLLAGRFQVVAQNPAFLQTKFGAAALGPWVGGLESDGEAITLRDATGQVIDTVDYQLGFPWPTVGDAPGYSIELINPNFDNDLGGNWRVSVVGSVQAQTNALIDAGSSWKYFKGLTEPSAPVTAWRARTFDDAGWSSGNAPFGYGETFIVTPLNDMRNTYSSVYFRRPFVVNDLSQISSLVLEAQYDDGFKVWINGFNVIDGQANMSPGEVPYSGTAGSALENFSFVTFNLNNPGSYLLPGTNVIAVQAHNSSISNSSDFFLDVRLSSLSGPATRGPTPGRVNSAFATNAPPQIRQVDHSPNEPRSAQAILISAKITDPEGVTNVVLQYQVVDPGNYIDLTDAAYSNNWVSVAMNDLGINGDGFPGDSIYSVQLPASIQTHRRLVRYRLNATDGRGLSVRVPYSDDPQPNFAYFVYNGIPAWTAAAQPGVTIPVNFGTNVMGRIPAYHLIAKSNSFLTATGWNPGAPNNQYGGDNYLWGGTFVYDGKVYDHIRYRARGGVWRYSMGKNAMKFDFNRGHDFEPRDNWGKRLNSKWTKVSLRADIQQGDYLHRGEQGMFESVGYRLFELAGADGLKTTHVQLRVIDAALEATPGNQYEGDFWGLYLSVEEPDGRLLDERGLPDGNIYDMEGGSGTLNQIGPTGPTDRSDLNAFLGAYNSGTNASIPDAWWRANLNLPKYYSYQAILQGIHHYDIADGKNYFYYRDPIAQQWTVIAWDLDLTWADNMYRGGQQGGDEPFKSRVLSNFSPTPARPALGIEFRNRVREIRDLLFNSDQAFRLIDEYATLLRGTNAGPTFLDADRSQWDYNPVMVNGAIVNTGKAGHGRFYQFPNEPVSRDFNGCVQLMKNYINYRSTNPTFSLDTISADGLKPNRPVITYLGPTNFPANNLSFRSSAFSGNGGGFASMKWRIGEITDTNSLIYDPREPHQYEIETVWESGELAFFNSDITIPSIGVKVGHRYRARVQMKDNTGRTSNWSLPVEFTVGEPAGVTELINSLRITEVMFNPAGSSEFEFIELYNASSVSSLDLNGVRLTQGVDYTIPGGTVLAPGGYLLIVGTTNLAAFRNYYGLSGTVPILGPWTGSLNNAGEQIVIRTAAGGTDIVAFEYADSSGWPKAADGAGHSMVLLDSALTTQNLGSAEYAGNWRSSTYLNGSPGRADSLPVRSVVLNEITAHTDYFDPQRPEYDSNDWIELYNAGNSNVVLGGWFLSDDPADLRKWAIPAVNLAPGAFILFDEVTGFHNPISIGFGLDKAGEQVFLSYLPGTAEDRVVDAVLFQGQENNFSWGRYPDGGAHWDVMARTRGTPNLPPQARLVINEVMYHPRPSALSPEDNTLDEFVELFNPTTQTITLSDTNGAWRVSGGIDFNFAAGTAIPANGFLILVNFNPTNGPTLTEFRRIYGLTNSTVPILGPYGGKLNNRSDRITLEKPQAPDVAGGSISWVVIDELIYGNQPPWVTTPDTNGASLQRVAFSGIGNNPANWSGANPTAGTVNVGGNRSPLFSPVAPQSVDEGNVFTLTLQASDPDVPTNTLSFEIVSGPPGLAVESNTGRLTLSTAEPDGPATHNVTVRVVDNGVPPLSDTMTFNLVINELNDPPVLSTIPNATIAEGSLLIFTNVAVDPDVPANQLSFTLDVAPAGATLDSATGVFRWTPGSQEGPTNYLVVVRVTDNGTPAASHTRSFVVEVQDIFIPPITEPLLTIRLMQNNTVLSWQAEANVAYFLERRDEVASGSWSPFSNFPAQPTPRILSVTNQANTARRFYRVMAQ